ncbi:MAG: hypothetical protein DHS20C19_29140 [Acidimicrobiales bacterium]|nr:MAG: hypothetical protein DHS20C19_29140 [Acidimicrobiales bacterium]
MTRRLLSALGTVALAVAVIGAPAAAQDDPVTVDDPVSTTSVAQLPPLETSTTTTTTIELSAPTSVAPPAPTVTSTVAPVATTVPTQVLGTAETNDELAHTGVEAGALASLGAGLIAAGTLLARRSRPRV